MWAMLNLDGDNPYQTVILSCGWSMKNINNDFLIERAKIELPTKRRIFFRQSVLF
jgi:hypothetical protein